MSVECVAVADSFGSLAQTTDCVHWSGKIPWESHGNGDKWIIIVLQKIGTEIRCCHENGYVGMGMEY